MPVHNWTKEYAWLFHDFHHEWLSALSRTLNGGLLPNDHYALIERWNGAFERDFPPRDEDDNDANPFVVVDTAPRSEVPTKPVCLVTVRREPDDAVVAACEVCLPDYHTGEVAWLTVAERAGALISDGIHLFLVNVHLPPPQTDYPHAAVWNRLGFAAVPFESDRQVTLASYEAVAPPKAYVEPVAVGDVLPDMPLFLVPGGHVLVPLEATYLAAWEGVPIQGRKLLNAGAS